MALLILVGLILYGALALALGFRREMTLLVLGMDEEQQKGARSDTILLARIQWEPAPRVVVVSLPRDTRVRIPGRSGHHKLNAAFSLDGLEGALETMAQNFGVRPDRYVVCRSEGLAQVVDALGGVVVDVPQAMDYDDQAQELHIHLKPGEQKLTGEEAVGFVRFRSDGRGDLGRIERQQQFLKILAGQALEPQNLWRWPRLLQAVRAMVDTDLNTRECLGLALRLRGLSAERVEALTLPGHPEYRRGISYYIPDTTQVSELLQG